MSVSKRERSNEQRLRALQKKKAQLEARKLSITVSTAAASRQHLVFASDSDESATNDVDPDDTLSGKLQLFGQSSSSDSEEEELGTKFSGDLSGQLFELQRKIGHDQRFRVDKRFLEKEVWEEQCQDQTETEDELRQQILQEKANALRIISSLFEGDNARSEVQAGDKKLSLTKLHSPATECPVLTARYDPTLSTCTQLELQPEVCLISDKGGNSPSHDSPRAPSLQHDAISTDRYYSVSEDIKDLFGSSQEQFSFLADREDDSHELSCDLPLSTTYTVAAPKWVETTSRHSSDSADSGGEIAITKHQASSSDTASTTGTKLFFHSSTPSLRNRLDENSFYHCESLRDLETNWHLTRTAMKQSFRKRRKDAAKHAKKRRKHFK